MVAFTAVLTACLFACTAMGAMTEDWDAEASTAWAPAQSPSASPYAASYVISSGTVPAAFQNRESGSVQVLPITSISLANSAGYKAQTTAAKAALNLPPVNSPMPVDNTRARHISFANLGKKTIVSFVSGNNGGPLFGGGAWVLAPNTYIAFSLPTPFIGN